MTDGRNNEARKEGEGLEVKRMVQEEEASWQRPEDSWTEGRKDGRTVERVGRPKKGNDGGGEYNRLELAIVKSRHRTMADYCSTV